MVSTSQLLSFLKNTENSIDATQTGATSGQITEEKQRFERALRNEIASRRGELNEISDQIEDLKYLAEDNDIFVSKPAIAPSPTRKADDPKTEFDQLTQSITEEISQFRTLIEDSGQQQVTSAKKTVRKPLYAIVGLSFAMFITFNDLLGLPFLVVGVVTALVGFAAIEIKGRSDGCLGTVGRLVYSGLGALYALIGVGLGLASISGMGSCSGFVCMDGLYLIIAVIGALIALVGLWILYTGIRNRLPTRL